MRTLLFLLLVAVSSFAGPPLDEPALHLSRFRLAWDQYQAGTRTRPPIALFVGDSNTAGQGSVGAMNAANKPLSFPTLLASELSSRGWAARESSWCGTNVSTTLAENVAAYDPRITWGTGWAPVSNTTLGGFLLSNSTTTGAHSFAPSQVWDTLELTYAQATGNGTFALNIDGAAAFATVNSSVSPTKLVQATYTVARGTHTLNIARVSGTVYIASAIVSDSQSKEISIVNAGVGRAVATTFISAGAFGPATGWAVMAPDLSVIGLIINDANNGGVLPSAYEATLGSLVATGLLSGDVLLTTSWPWTATTYSAQSEPYRAAIRRVAKAYRVPLVEFEKSGWPPGFSTALNYDTLHPNSSGAALLARMLADAITVRFADYRLPLRSWLFASQSPATGNLHGSGF